VAQDLLLLLVLEWRLQATAVLLLLAAAAYR
jgi:hypothetical protein